MAVALRLVWAHESASTVRPVSASFQGAPSASFTVYGAQPRRNADGAMEGEVLTIDRFGNAITNLLARDASTVFVANHAVRVVRTYSDAMEGELIALTGSSGLLEIAVRDGHAASRLRLTRGQTVILVQAARG